MEADDFVVGDLRDQGFCRAVDRRFDEVYQLAADMGSRATRSMPYRSSRILVGDMRRRFVLEPVIGRILKVMT
jgi:hypothetical protein